MGNRDIDRRGSGEVMDREDDNMPTVGGIFLDYGGCHF